MNFRPPGIDKRRSRNTQIEGGENKCTYCIYTFTYIYMYIYIIYIHIHIRIEARISVTFYTYIYIYTLRMYANTNCISTAQMQDRLHNIYGDVPERSIYILYSIFVPFFDWIIDTWHPMTSLASTFQAFFVPQWPPRLLSATWMTPGSSKDTVIFYFLKNISRKNVFNI